MYKQQAAVSGEGASRLAVASVAAPGGGAVAAVAPLATPAKPLRAVPVEKPLAVDKMTEGENLSKPTTQPFDTVRYDVNVQLPLSALAALEKEGKSLTLLPGKGLSAKPRYSNPADASPSLRAHGDCDFVRSATLVLKSDAGVPLRVTVPVQAMPGDSINEDAPSGFVSAIVDSGTNTILKRAVTNGQMAFVNEYPGQTVDTLGNFMFDVPNKPDASYVQANPPAAVLYFYNRNPAVIEQKAQILAAHADAQGMVSAPRALLKAAKQEAEESLRTKIGYTNVTDPDKMSLKFETLPVVTLQENGTYEARPVSLAAAHLESSFGRQVSAVAQQLSKNPDAALSIQKKAGYITLQGYLEFEYLKVHPNFQLKPMDE